MTFLQGWKTKIAQAAKSSVTREVQVIARKELEAYFNSLIAYVVIIVFLLVCGYFYASPLFIVNMPTIRHFVTLVPLMFLFFIPAITMRLFSEEIKSGTIEILFTQPLKDIEILLGKYIGAVIFIKVIILSTLFYPLTLSLIGKLDWGQVISSYIGLVLLGCMFAAAGLFSSTLTKNQIVAFIISFLICFMFFVLGKTTTFLPPFLAGIVDYIGIDRHFENIARGVIDTRDLVYYFSVTGFFLFSALYALKTRH